MGLTHTTVGKNRVSALASREFAPTLGVSLNYVKTFAKRSAGVFRKKFRERAQRQAKWDVAWVSTIAHGHRHVYMYVRYTKKTFAVF